MPNNKHSDFEYRRPRSALNRTFERIADVPWNMIGRGRAITESAKRRLYEHGIVGRATVIKAPRQPDAQGDTEGFWRVLIEMPGRPAFEARVWQSYSGLDWRGLQPGMVVECRVDAHDSRKVLLCAAEPSEPEIVRIVSAAEIVDAGRSAEGTVLRSAPFGQRAPGTDDEIYLLDLELRSPQESAPWTVQILQRVPSGLEPLIGAGNTLAVAFVVVDRGESVAIDWHASQLR